MSAYQDAVTAINMIATDPRPEIVRHDLEALRALIDLLVEKLPDQQSEYQTDGPDNSTWRCKACSALVAGPQDWRPLTCPRCGEHDWSKADG
jgi:rubrerythrin